MATKSLPVRLDLEIIERLERLAKAMAQPGVPVGVSTAARAALLRGLELFEAEHRVARSRKK